MKHSDQIGLKAKLQETNRERSRRPRPQGSKFMRGYHKIRGHPETYKKAPSLKLVSMALKHFVQLSGP